ncbi:hypothetical protein GGC65_000414 [Sphingopyxis sp. OAS728]|uniref:nuclear transport factor 2 family protein n=1 Tax=Sphingopyxis sp. OAS728 TaxID=2663823 RepID=UPI00178A99A2|nr:nuclear transport factor 2 family protein [Sphingopyxis sp. OAS728]MBE1525958.1 hypothetical protein [Sphingopyxis sp. OAS728]
MSSSIDRADQAAPVDFNRLLRANLQRVFNERNADLRAAAIAELYVADPIMYEPDAVIEGREAISAVAGKLLEQFGPDFRFTPEADGVGQNGIAALRWYAGTSSIPHMVTGTDMAEVVDGRIARLWVLLNPTG